MQSLRSCCVIVGRRKYLQRHDTFYLPKTRRIWLKLRNRSIRPICGFRTRNPRNPPNSRNIGIRPKLLHRTSSYSFSSSAFAKSSTRQQNHEEEEEEEMNRVIVTGAICNLALAGLKGTGGIVSGSTVMIADALHSLTDLLSDIVTMAAVKWGREPADEDHPYGHGKYEAIGSLLVGGIVCGGGIGLSVHTYECVADAMATTTIATSTSSATAVDGLVMSPALLSIALGSAVVSIVCKEALFRWTLRGTGRAQRPLVSLLLLEHASRYSHTTYTHTCRTHTQLVKNVKVPQSLRTRGITEATRSLRSLLSPASSAQRTEVSCSILSPPCLYLRWSFELVARSSSKRSES